MQQSTDYKNFLIGTLNVCGLKRRSVYPEFYELVRKYDIFCTVETKLDKHDIVYLPGYQFISMPRKQKYIRKSGGIGFFVKDEIYDYISHVESSSDYITWLKIKKSFTSTDQDIMIGIIYVPPQNSKYYNEDDLVALEEETTSACSKYDYVYLTGDFNAQTANMRDFTCADRSLDKYLDLDQDTVNFFDQVSFLENNNISTDRVSLDKKKNNNGHRIIELCKNNNMFLLNGRYGKDKNLGKYTFREQSVIDYSISSEKGFSVLTNFEILDLDRLCSDGHSLLIMTLNWPSQGNENNMTYPIHTRKNVPKCPKWDPRNANSYKGNINMSLIDKINENLTLIKLNPSQDKIDTVVQSIAHVFQMAAQQTPANCYVPKNCLKPNKKPWFGYQCNKAKLSYNKARKSFQLYRSSVNRRSLLCASKQYKKTMNKYINKYKLSQQSKLRKMHKKSPKEYWKYLNSINRKKNIKQPAIEDLFEFFKTLNANDNSEQDKSMDDGINRLNLEDDDMSLNSPITTSEISKCITKLKNSKAPGSDQIINEYLKNTESQMLTTYVCLFNLILDTGFIPQQWTEGMIKPIYKNKGDSTSPENYRPITLLSCLAKLFTAILNERINVFLSENDILSENQAGFRKHYSTTDHIFVLHSLFELFKMQKKNLYCAFIDFSKAFDSVWRIGMWKKLLDNSINGRNFRVIYNLYQNIKSCVILNDSISAFFVSSCGLRQGENLSPVLFSIFLNDLETHLQSNGNPGVELEYSTDDLYIFTKLVVLLYADDTVLLADSPEHLQKSLDDFVHYCKNWKLNINYEKTKIVIFGSRKLDQHVFRMEGNKIEIVKSYRYLGVLLSNNGSFLNARKSIYDKANKAMHLLYMRINNLDLPLDLQLKLFDSTILPIITYGCEIWGFENLQMFERIHNSFLRSVIKCRKSTPLYMLYGELGRHPIEITIKTRIIGYWTRLITGNQLKLANLMYQKLMSTDHQFKWIKNVQSILQEAGRNDFWINQNENLPTYGNQIIKKTLIDQFVQKWHQSLYESSKGLNYRLFKSDHLFENYLTIIPRNKYLPIIKYRTANHYLPVETLRWQGVEISDRKCILCAKQDIADEFHYLLVCPVFKESRQKYINPYYYKRPNVIKYKELFTSNSLLKLSNLSKFVTLIMKEFKR